MKEDLLKIAEDSIQDQLEELRTALREIAEESIREYYLCISPLCPLPYFLKLCKTRENADLVI